MFKLPWIMYFLNLASVNARFLYYQIVFNLFLQTKVQEKYKFKTVRFTRGLFITNYLKVSIFVGLWFRFHFYSVRVFPTKKYYTSVLSYMLDFLIIIKN